MFSKPSFEQVQRFFNSWGLLPADVKSDDGLSQLNTFCYGRMKVEGVLLFGKDFLGFIQRQVANKGGQYYLVATYWDEIEEDWQGFNRL